MPSNRSTLTRLSLYLILFSTLIWGILWQGGEFFWFGFAGASPLLLLLFFIHRHYSDTVTLPKSTLNLVIGLFAGWCFLTVFWSVVPHISLVRAITIFSAPVALYLYFYLTHASIKWNQLWYIIIAVGLLLVLYSLVEVYLGITTPNSLFFNKNTHAAYLNLIILPTAAYFILAKNTKVKWFLGISLFLLIFSHALPGSRGATLGQLIGLAMLLYPCRKFIGRQNLSLLSGIYIGAFSLATLTTSNILRFVKYKLEDADLGRWEIWEGALNLLRDSPWYGQGVGTYWLIHPAYRHINDPSSGQNPHNDFLQYWIEAGLPGLILLLIFVALLMVSWWKTVHQSQLSDDKKIESCAIIGAITAVGFHAFFTFNLGIFSILFLTGLLLGRYLHINQHTRSINLARLIPIRTKLFSVLSIILGCLVLFYFVSITLFSSLHTRAAQAYIDGDITQADKLNSKAISIYPYDDRPYLLYAYIYEKILEKVVELDPQKKQFFYIKALSFIDNAIHINPYRAKSYLLKASIIENHSELTSTDLDKTVESLLLKSLKVNPRFIEATKKLANFYDRRGNLEQAASVLFKQLQYWHPNTIHTLKFYHFAEEAILKSGNKQYIELLETRNKKILEILKLKGIDVSTQLNPGT